MKNKKAFFPGHFVPSRTVHKVPPGHSVPSRTVHKVPVGHFRSCSVVSGRFRSCSVISGRVRSFPVIFTTSVNLSFLRLCRYCICHVLTYWYCRSRIIFWSLICQMMRLRLRGRWLRGLSFICGSGSSSFYPYPTNTVLYCILAIQNFLYWYLVLLNISVGVRPFGAKAVGASNLRAGATSFNNSG
jgi:hypothetical protein